jgi:hypothetical protein
MSTPDDTVAWAIELLACAVARSDHVRATRLLGAAERMREELGAHLEGIELDLHERTLTTLTTAIAPAALAAAWETGRDAPLEQILADATRVEEP